MSKRHREEGDEDRWRRKLRRYERKLARRSRRVVYSSEDEMVQEPYLSQDLENPAPEVLESNEFYNNDFASNSCEAPIMQLPDEPTVPLSETTAEVTPAPPVDAVVEVDPDLLNALGDCHTDIPEWGEDIYQDISQRWEPVFKMGLKKETKEELLKKYLFPKNMPSSKAPPLSPEVSAMLTEACRNRDTRLCSKQNQLGHASAALGRAMTGILTKKMDTPEVLRILNDVGKLISDSHYLETDTRRSLIMPLLDKSYITLFKDRKRDKFLFGENLGEFIKSSRGIKKTGQLLTPAPPSTSATSANLNRRGPPRYPARFAASGASRGGGQRAPPYTARRTQQPPPAPTRRAPPPPAGPPARRQPTQSTSRSQNRT